MTIHPRPNRPVPDSPSDPSPHMSSDPATDLRRLLAGSKWNVPGTAGFPVRTAAGEWMIPVIVDLPYAMLTSLEATAQACEIGDIVRAALVVAGHGTPDDIAGVRSDRFATLDEQRECGGTIRL